MPYLVHHFVKQLRRVGDDQESAFVFLQIATEPFDGIGVQMVGRLVEDQRVGVGEQNPCQFDPSTLSSGERAQLLAHHLLRQSEACRHGGRFGLRRVASGLFEILHGLVVTVHGLGHDVRIRVGHVLFGLAYALDDGGDVSSAHHTVERGLLGIRRMRVLREVTKLARDAHFAGRRQHVAGDHAGQRGLAGAIAADETDFVAFGDMEVGGMQQRARANLNLKPLRLNRHASIPLFFPQNHYAACHAVRIRFLVKRQSNIIPNTRNRSDSQ